MTRLSAIAILLFVTATALAGEVIRRGETVPARTKTTSLRRVLASPQRYTEKAVVVEGIVRKSCAQKGCWMELAPADGTSAVRVTFKDYGFFVPLDSKGMKARAAGVTAIKVLSKADADHLEGEGAAKFKRNPDGSANEVSFIASGVELRSRR